MTNNTKFDLTTAHILLNKFSCFFKVQAVVFSLKQTTNTDVLSRVVRCATMSMTGEVQILFTFIQLLKTSPLFKETTFIFFSRYKVSTSNSIFNISFAQDKAPLQAMEEHSESTDDKGKRNIIVSYRERIVWKFLLYSKNILDFLASAF